MVKVSLLVRVAPAATSPKLSNPSTTTVCGEELLRVAVTSCTSDPLFIMSAL